MIVPKLQEVFKALTTAGIILFNFTFSVFSFDHLAFLIE